MSHKKIGPDRFSRFEVYWIQTNRQTDKQTPRQTSQIYIQNFFTNHDDSSNTLRSVFLWDTLYIMYLALQQFMGHPVYNISGFATVYICVKERNIMHLGKYKNVKSKNKLALLTMD